MFVLGRGRVVVKIFVSGSDWVFGMEMLGLGLYYVTIRVIILRIIDLLRVLFRILVRIYRDNFWV